MSANQKAEFSIWPRRDGAAVLDRGDGSYERIVAVVARRACKTVTYGYAGKKNNCADALFSCVQVQNLYSANANSFANKDERRLGGRE